MRVGISRQWVLASALVAYGLMVGLCIAGFLIVGPEHAVQRVLFMVSLALLVIGVPLILWGRAQQAEAVTLLRTGAVQALELQAPGPEQPDAPRGFEALRPEPPPPEPPLGFAVSQSDRDVALGAAGTVAEQLEVLGAPVEAARLSELALLRFREAEPVAVSEETVQSTRVIARLSRGALAIRRRARLALGAGLSAFAIAVPTGIGTTAAAVLTDSAHIGTQATQSAQAPGGGESCTQAVEKVIAIKKQDPGLARLYAAGTPGLPALVDPEVEQRCGGSFDALMK